MRPLIILLCSFCLHYQCYGQNMNWKGLPKEVNDGVLCMSVYDNKLIVGGAFKMAGDKQANRIAAWDGEHWSALGSGVGGEFALVTEMEIEGNNLYIAGGFDSVGDIAAKNIAMWDGTQWNSLGSGSNRQINCLAVYNNQIYAGGSFDSIGGTRIKYIAKWDGVNWSSLGKGIYGHSVVDLCVYQNELYVLGVFDSAGTIRANYIARWNDTTWSKVDSGLEYGYSSMIEWNSRLIVGSESFLSSPDFLIKEWNGDKWGDFSKQATPEAQVFSIYNKELFVGESFFSTGAPSSSSVHKWDSVDTTWKPVGTGINQTTYALCSYKGELYCGGRFTKQKNASCNYLAKYTDITGIEENQEDGISVTIYPIPAQQSFTIDIESTTAEYPLLFEVYNMLGEKVYGTSLHNKRTAINNFEQKGIFIYSLKTAEQQLKTGKIAVE